MDDFEKELKLGFLEEADQAIDDVEQSFLALETDPNDIENLNKIFRLAHNLKGSAKAVGFDDLGAFTHQFESFILKIKNGEFKVTAQVVSLLLKANDHLNEMVQKLKEDIDCRFDSTEISNQLSSFQPETTAETTNLMEMPSTPAMNPVENESSSEQEVVSEMETMTEGEPENSTIHVNPELDIIPAPTVHSPVEEANKPSSPPESKGTKSTTGVDESIRVALHKVELLINFVGEMTILQSVLREQASESTSPLLRKTIHQLGKVGKEIQELSMGLRMVPIKPTFQKMQRIVRDTSHTLGKDIQIILSGEEHELDKTVLEKINDPLVHLIRNSVDHGIEDTQTRIQNGKSAQGQVHLRAFHQGGKLILEVADDGGGLNTQKLKAKAIQKGILRPEVELSEKEAFNLIFAPGFSTKEQITDVSGRGVGMDVVKTNINELGGEIQIESKLGQGTTFRITLPLTLAIVDAMVLAYGTHRFVIPISQVFETLRPDPKMIQHNTNMGDVLILREENIPIIKLGDFFGIKNSTPDPLMIALVIKTGGQSFAILIDDIVGQFQVVVKQLGRDIKNNKGISGTTILGNGKPALILDPQELFKRKFTPSYSASSVFEGGKSA